MEQEEHSKVELGSRVHFYSKEVERILLTPVVGGVREIKEMVEKADKRAKLYRARAATRGRMPILREKERLASIVLKETVTEKEMEKVKASKKLQPHLVLLTWVIL